MPTESVPRAEPHLWTAWTDYFATGEGRTLLGLICSAASPEDARQRFGEVFDPYYASGCQVEKGVAQNDATQFLWSAAALTALEELDPRAAVEAISRIHINLS